MKTETLPCLRINCPAWYQRPGVVAWLRAMPGPATWGLHGTEPGECSDLFMTFDHGDGSDSDMPEDLWAEGCRLCDEAGLGYGVIWLANVG
jgi:hypothetical protein